MVRREGCCGETGDHHRRGARDGVSIKTVSNVLNNTGSMRPETRQRVQDAIERLGYRVNVSARAMKTGGTKLIGLAITDFCQPFMPISPT